jgi:hypothetical protein
MHYAHENVVVGIDMWLFSYIIQKVQFFFIFKTLFLVLLRYFDRSSPSFKRKNTVQEVHVFLYSGQFVAKLHQGKLPHV